MGYAFAQDATRIDIGKTELTDNDSNYKLPDKYTKIVVDTNFPQECYSIKIMDTGFASNAICLKSYSDDYDDVEICRYMNGDITYDSKKDTYYSTKLQKIQDCYFLYGCVCTFFIKY